MADMDATSARRPHREGIQPAADDRQPRRRVTMQDEHSYEIDDRTLRATGKVTEAFEWIERARGRLYDFHQMIGRADLLLEKAATLLDEADAHELADLLRTEIIGRNVLDGRWTFQIVEEFDSVYYFPIASAEERIRNELVAGRRHVYESTLKEQRRTPGLKGHERRPPGGDAGL